MKKQLLLVCCLLLSAGITVAQPQKKLPAKQALPELKKMLTGTGLRRAAARNAWFASTAGRKPGSSTGTICGGTKARPLLKITSLFIRDR